MFGFLNIWKPVGPTSYDVIRHVRRCMGRKVKVGHAGTLDPLAEGVLVVCLGPATRLTPLVQSRPKQYVTLARLGAASTTDDAEGDIRKTSSAEPPPGRVEQVVRQFIGTIRQVPPAHSAVKIDGRRAYELARAGQRPNLRPKEVTIHSLEIIDYEYPNLRLRVTCGSGTYIRSLVRDIGGELGVGAYCEAIIRESVGPFRADQAVKVADIRADNIEQLLISPVEAVPPAARITVTDAQARDLSLGRPINRPAATAPTVQANAATTPPAQLLFGAIDSAGRLIGLLRPDQTGSRLHPSKIFIRPAAMP